MVHLSHLYVTTGKTIALTIWTFVVSGSVFTFPIFVRTPVIMDQGPLHAEGQGLGKHT